MPEQDDSQERTHEPSQKRLDDARQEGQVPRSTELATVVSLLGGAAGLWFFGGSILGSIGDVFRFAMSPSREQLTDKDAMLEMLIQAIYSSGAAVAPFMLMMLILGICSFLFVGGWNFTVKSMQPKFSKMSPIEGLKRMFGILGVVNLLKALAKVALVSTTGVLLLFAFWEDLFMLASLPLMPAIASASNMFFWSFLIMSSSLIVVALIDVPFQIWNTMRKLKMTEQEMRDEFKETEGKPEVKSKIRQMQHEMAQRRMMEDVPDADVIVTNPTHFAVALKYDQLSDHAPRIVAMGVDNIALKIREIGEFHDVQIYEEPPLARVLYHTGKIGDEIPAGLYLAVAQILAYVYQVNKPQRFGQPRPIRPHTEIPEEFEKYSHTTRPTN